MEFTRSRVTALFATPDEHPSPSVYLARADKSEDDLKNLAG